MSKTGLIASLMKALLGNKARTPLLKVTSDNDEVYPYYSTGRKSLRVKGHNLGQKCTTCGDNCGQCGTTG